MYREHELQPGTAQHGTVLSRAGSQKPITVPLSLHNVPEYGPSKRFTALRTVVIDDAVFSHVCSPWLVICVRSGSTASASFANTLCENGL